jgi:hypothetical protein
MKMCRECGLVRPELSAARRAGCVAQGTGRTGDNGGGGFQLHAVRRVRGRLPRGLSPKGLSPGGAARPSRPASSRSTNTAIFSPIVGRI